jgi:hypothetical protein
MNGLGIYLLHLVHTMEATVREDYLFFIGCKWSISVALGKNYSATC